MQLLAKLMLSKTIMVLVYEVGRGRNIGIRTLTPRSPHVPRFVCAYTFSPFADKRYKCGGN